ncbi:MAG: LPS export ABC transporter permease LptF [Rhodospirillales bacterium]|nr:LPS export ABC transporter permease LptF [Rhodospirillales bacterium]
MNRITVYILRQVLLTTVFVLVTLTLAIWLTQSLRFIELIVNRGLGLGAFFYLTILLMPNFLFLVTPIALFMSTLFVYNRLTVDSELVVMRAVGFGPGQLARPAILLGVLATLLGYGLSLYLVPLAFGKFKELHSDIRSDYSGLLLQEGAFTNIGSSLTVYVRAREANGDLRGILVHDSRDPASPVTLLAERGTLATSEDGPRVILLNGNRQQVDRAAGKLSLLYFDRYSVEIGQTATSREFRWREPGERYIHELLWPDMADSHDRQYAPRLIAEGHARLSAPLYALGLVLVGLACMLTGDFNRRGLSQRLLVAAACGLGVQTLSIAVPNLSARTPAAIPFLYAIPLAIMALSAWVLSTPALRRRRTADRPQPAAA